LLAAVFCLGAKTTKMKFETHYVNNVKPDLRTLKLIKQMFDLHSDGSTMCNGYRSLCSIIDEMDKQPVIEIENEIKINGNTITVTDKSGLSANGS